MKTDEIHLRPANLVIMVPKQVEQESQLVHDQPVHIIHKL